MSPDLRTSVGEVQLRSPVLTAAGTSGYGDELAGYGDLSQLGAVVTKSLAAFAWEGNAPPRVVASGTHMLNAVGLDGQITWSAASRGQWEFRCPMADTKAQLQDALKGPTGMDVHAWCFTPASFRLMIHDLHALGLIRLREVSHFPTEGCEFFITLGANGAGPDCSRLDLLNQIGRELSAPAGA